MSEKQRVIWKYELEPGWNHVLMPGFVRTMGVGFQGDHLCMWCMVVEGAEEAVHEFFAAMTGEYLPTELLGFFVGTAQCRNGIVVHVFEGRG